jgi:hypothetical protein
MGARDLARLYAQAAEMESIEKLTTILSPSGPGKDGRVDRGARTSPVIKTRIDQWIKARMKRLSPVTLRSPTRACLISSRSPASPTSRRPSSTTYDYFRRQLEDQQRERTELAKFFGKAVESMRQER